ncbi:MAG: copper oxidase [Rhizobiales bacterium]|nr:copper oxidase [Hyphomicrobiales bacterium]
MRSITLGLGLVILSANLTLAAGGHDGGHAPETGHNTTTPAANHPHHGQNDAKAALGNAGDPAHVSRDVSIIMEETNDGRMIFAPSDIMVKAGETLRLRFLNKGENDHEFVMGDPQGLEQHRLEMLAASNAGHPHHEHGAANMISLIPGETGEIIWTFPATGTVAFACLIPGHYELGMHGKIIVE